MNRIAKTATALLATSLLAGCGTTAGATALATAPGVSASASATPVAAAIAASKCPSPTATADPTEIKCSDGTELYVFANQSGQQQWTAAATAMGAPPLSKGSNWVLIDNCSSYSTTTEQGVAVSVDLYNQWIGEWNGLTQVQRNAFEAAHNGGGFATWLSIAIPNWRQLAAASIPARCATSTTS